MYGSHLKFEVILLALGVLVAPGVAFGQEEYPVLGTIWVGTSPTDVIFSPDGDVAYVSNMGSDTVSVIDVKAGVVIADVLVGDGPFNPGITPDGSRLFVPNLLSKDISVLDTFTNTVVATIPTALGFTRTYPSSVVFTQNGDTALAYVVNAAGGSDFISIIDVRSLTVVGRIDIPLTSTANAMSITPDGVRAYLTNGDANCVAVIDVLLRALITAIPVGVKPINLAITPAGEKVYVANCGSGDISVIDTVTNMVVGTIPVGGNPFRVLVSSDGVLAYVACGGTDVVMVVDCELDAVIAQIPVMPLTAGDPQDEMVLSPRGDRAFLTGYQGDVVAVIDTSLSSGSFASVVSSIPVGDGPADVAMPSAADLMYVLNYLSGSVTAVGMPVRFNTPAGVNVEVSLLAGVKVVFERVVRAGQTLAEEVEAGPGEWADFGSPLILYEIWTTAGYEGVIDVKVSLPGDFAGWEELARMYQNGSGWSDVTAEVDVGNAVVRGRTRTLGKFMVAVERFDRSVVRAAGLIDEILAGGGLSRWVEAQLLLAKRHLVGSQRGDATNGALQKYLMGNYAAALAKARHALRELERVRERGGIDTEAIERLVTLASERLAWLVGEVWIWGRAWGVKERGEGFVGFGDEGTTSRRQFSEVLRGLRGAR